MLEQFINLVIKYNYFSRILLVILGIWLCKKFIKREYGQEPHTGVKVVRTTNDFGSLFAGIFLIICGILLIFST